VKSNDFVEGLEEIVEVKRTNDLVSLVDYRLKKEEKKIKNVILYSNNNNDVFIGIVLSFIHEKLNYDLFDEIIVSTDDEEISLACKSFGVKVIENRPKNLSDDLTPTLPVIKYIVEGYLKSSDLLDHVVCLYPGSVLLQKVDLIEAQNLFSKKKNQFVIAATRYSHPIQRSFTINDDHEVMDYNKNALNQKTQDFKEYFHDAGQFYWGNKNLWTSCDGIISNSLAITIPNWRIQDIDSLDDWKRAEVLHMIIRDQNT
jgi:N-acylneuraminate cytidylyltransferase